MEKAWRGRAGDSDSGLAGEATVETRVGEGSLWSAHLGLTNILNAFSRVDYFPLSLAGSYILLFSVPFQMLIPPKQV